MKGRFLSPPTLLSFAIAGAFLFFLVTRFDIDLGAMWDSLRASNPLFFVLALLTHYTTFLFRGARWRLLLENAEQSPHTPRPTTLYFSSLIVLGWCTNSVTGFRLGDAYRAHAYASDTGGSFPRTIGTIMAERVLDMAMVFLLLAIAALFLVTKGVGTSWIFAGLGASMGGALAGVLLLLLMWRFRPRLVRFLPGPLKEVYQRFHQGTMESFRRRLPLVTLLGLLAWLAEVARLLFVAEALDISLGLPLVVFATLANSILTLVPITPGGLGAVEFGVTRVLLLSTKIETEAVAFSVVALDRSISWLSVIVVGAGIFLGREVAKGRRRRASAGHEVLQQRE